MCLDSVAVSGDSLLRKILFSGSNKTCFVRMLHGSANANFCSPKNVFRAHRLPQGYNCHAVAPLIFGGETEIFHCRKGPQKFMNLSP